MLGMSTIVVAQKFDSFSSLLHQAENSRLLSADKISAVLDELNSRLSEASPDERQRLVIILAHRSALQGDFNNAEAKLREVLAAQPAPHLMTRAYSLKAQINLMRSDYAAAFTDLELAIKSINPDSTHKIQFEVYELAARALSYAGEKDKALSYGQEALALAKRNGDQYQQCVAAVSMLFPHTLSGSYQGLTEGLIQAEPSCNGQSSLLQATVLAFKVDLLTEQAHYDQALTEIVKAENLYKVAGYELGISNLAIKRAIILLKRGELESGVSSLNAALQTMSPGAMKMERTRAYQYLAEAYVENKNWQAASETYQRLRDVEQDYRNEQKEIRGAYLQVQFNTALQDKKIAQLMQEQQLLQLNEDAQSEKRRLLQFGVGAVSVICILLMLALHRLRNQSLQLRKLAQIDGLTGLHNRRHALMLAEQLYASCLRRQSPMAVVMVDLDLFKEINDRFGHAAGDEVLRSAARHFASCLRKQDVIGRTGGEEFAIFLPDTNLNAAMSVVERCRNGLGDVQEGAQRRSVTASFGIAVAINDRATLDELLQQADKALYNAKASGRNQVAIARDLAFAASAYDEPASLI